MRILQVDPSAPDAGAIAEAADVLRRGGLVAFPTETVYGLGANALDAASVRRIYDAKGRPSFNPLIVHVPDAAAARALAAHWPDAAERLAAAFWPGPLTLVVRKRPQVPDEVTARLPNVALRVPAHPVALALLRAAQLPVAAPSANRFTQLSPTTAAHVARGLGERVDLILDGGPTTVGIESTVVELTGDTPRLLRPGLISVEQLEPITGPLARATPPADPEAPRPAPGMVDRHYAPKARVALFAPDDREDAARVAREAGARGEKVGALLLGDLDAPVAVRRRMPTEPAAYARALYAALHELDEAGCDVVIVERVPEDAAWEGVRDRIERAAV